MMDMDMMGGGMAVAMVLFAIFWILFGLVLFALAVTALIWMVRALRQQGMSGSSSASSRGAAHDLERRYASGELSREQYLQYKADLS